MGKSYLVHFQYGPIFTNNVTTIRNDGTFQTAYNHGGGPWSGFLAPITLNTGTDNFGEDDCVHVTQAQAFEVKFLNPFRDQFKNLTIRLGNAFIRRSKILHSKLKLRSFSLP